MNKKAVRLVMAAVIAAAGIFLLIVLLNSIRPVIHSNIFIIPGRFLYLCFLEAAFYLPLFFLLSSFFLIADYYNTRIFSASLFSLLPFFTFSLLLRTADYISGIPAADFIVDNIGVSGGSIFLSLLLVIELLVMIRIMFGKRPRQQEQTEIKAESAIEVEPVAEAAPESGAEHELEAKTETDVNHVHEHTFEPVPLELDWPGKSFEEPDMVEPILEPYIEDEAEPETVLESSLETISEPSIEASIEQLPEPVLEAVKEDDFEDNFEDDFEEAADLETIEELDEVDSVEELVDIDPMLSSDDTVESSQQQKNEISVKKPKKPGRYSVPVDNILEQYEDNNYWIVDEQTKNAAEVLRATLEEFRIAAEVTGISRGPVITMFEILPAPGVKLSKIVNLADNIALRLAASRVRIVAPIPGKHAVGIEVPNKDRAIVSFKEILEADNLKKSRMAIPVVLGKDITGGARIIDLVQTPHLLIAGATGSGKSVCVNSLICSLLYSRTPEEVKMILIDPKIVELKMYNDIPHLLTPVITEPKKAFQALQYATCEMERRYTLLNALGVRDVKAYNRKVRESRLATDLLPYIVIIVDEFADLMATTGKELENVISRLAAMSRAVGIHLVLATQRPSVDVITGLIKANIPSRIAFMVASKTDSRIIIDSMGADKLLGKGDMLFTSAWDPNPVRIQGAYLSDDEVERITDHVKTLGEPEYIDDEIFISDDDSDDFELESAGSGDPLMDSAVQIVVEAGKASASYLQRRLKIGYNRAARLVEEMEERGIVGPANGSKPREILHIPDRS